MKSEKVSRRSFLKSTAASATAAGLLQGGAAPSVGAVGANDRVRIACVGIRGQGKTHITKFLDIKDHGVEVVALCDVDSDVLGERAAEVEQKTGKRPKTYRDIRQLLEDDSIDVISTATPNHWHALITIWACQAGKDVYVEKPASWCVREGKKMVEAARKYNRIVQVGMQARSFPHILERIPQLQDGLIGDIYLARGLCYKRRDSIGFKEESNPPKNLDFDLWLGPAGKHNFHANLVHYNWHWFWAFGNGDIGNQGIHEMDLARLAVEQKGKVKVYASGGRYGYEDQGQTPNTLTVSITSEDNRRIEYGVRGRYTNAEEGVQLGDLYYGSEGFLAGANWGGGGGGYPNQDQTLGNWQPKFGYDGKPYGGKRDFKPEAPFDETYHPHYLNFIQAVRSRKAEDLNADILEGHKSAVLMHIANISYRLGRELTFDLEKEVFVGDGAAEANPFLTREYPAEFAVPEKV